MKLVQMVFFALAVVVVTASARERVSIASPDVGGAGHRSTQRRRRAEVLRQQPIIEQHRHQAEHLRRVA